MTSTHSTTCDTCTYSAMTTKQQLADAVTAMVMRYGHSNRRYIRAKTDSDQHKWMRACDRQFQAIQRLTEALRTADV